MDGLILKTCSKCAETKPVGEFGKRANRPSGVVSHCKACAKIADAKRYADSPEKAKARSAARYAANPEKSKATTAAWQLANPEKISVYNAKYYAANPEKEKARGAARRAANPEKVKADLAKWHAANLAKHRASGAKRKAIKLNATPGWADLNTIKAIYAGCPEGHHVDHFYPLKGKSVCGLHVADNLQYLTARENLSKGAKHPGDFMLQRGFLA